MRPARLALFSAVGACLGFAMEYVHMRAGVWVPPPGRTLPAWILGVYFAGLFGAGVLLRRVEIRYADVLRPKNGTVAIEAVVLVLLFFSPPLLCGREVAFAAVLLAYVSVRLLAHRQPGDVWVAGLVSVIDAGCELALVASGGYSYRVAGWFPLPLWLAPLWAGIGLGLRRVYAFALHPMPRNGANSAIQGPRI